MSSEERQLILVVDDEEQLRKLKRVLLERAGYCVLVAASGPEALAISRSYAGDIHLLVSDIEMQGMSGLDLARKMLTERPNLRVLLNSGNPGYAQEIDFPFLAKPFLPEQLRDAVARLLQKWNTSEAGSSLHPEEQSSVSPSQPAPVDPIRNNPDKVRRGRLSHAAAFWAVAAAIVLAAIPLALYQLRLSFLSDILTLHATRGLMSAPMAMSGRPLILNLDISGLPQQDSYRIEILTEAGQLIAACRAPAKGLTARATCPGLGPGIDFVLLYGPSGNLLREYTLRVRGKQVATP